jgi:hypothetical protein
MEKYVCIENGISHRTERQYFSEKIYEGHDMNHEYFLSINILPNIGDLVLKKHFIILAEFRNKRINEILND